MEHTMQLQPKPFERIRQQKKTVELRLYDEKRRAVSIGDRIWFLNAADKNQKILTDVTGLFVFHNFRELYDALPLTDCGYLPSELKTAAPEDMECFYPAAEQKKWGVVGIQIRLIAP